MIRRPPSMTDGPISSSDHRIDKDIEIIKTDLLARHLIVQLSDYHKQ